MRKAIIIILLAFLVIGCAQSTPEPTPIPSSTPAPTNTPTPTLIALSYDELIESLLLTLDDLRPGYQMSDDLSGPLDQETLEEMEAFNTLGFLNSQGDFTAYQVGYINFTNVSQPLAVGNMAIVLSTEEAGKEYIEIYPTLITDPENLQPISFHTVGEESKAWEQVKTSGDIPFTTYHLAIRQRNVIVRLIYAAHSEAVEFEEFEEYVEILEQRLNELIPVP